MLALAPHSRVRVKIPIIFRKNSIRAYIRKEERKRWPEVVYPIRGIFCCSPAHIHSHIDVGDLEFRLSAVTVGVGAGYSLCETAGSTHTAAVI